MIAQLKGSVSAHGVDYAILDVSGVGYLVHTTREAAILLSKQKKEVVLWTHLAVREISLDLYGFLTEREMSFFEMLISVSGIGPKSALAIMNLEAVETLSSAIIQGDTTYLTKVSGIGRKSAEKIVIELRDKMTTLGDGETGIHSGDTEAIEALLSLGYSKKEAREALRSVPKDIKDTGKRLTHALKTLGNG
ncbi:Holliday junction branch migration protein RuvA [Candidatus Kaiserbacteria bacterium]|nr:Holliday junction branch migration protein RuvA [Candidatus Kaiserbacteria bacterium]